MCGKVINLVRLVPFEQPYDAGKIEKVCFYDFNKWDLRPESMVSLDKLVETLNDNPNITIELMSHTDCRGNDQDNQILSQKRAGSRFTRARRLSSGRRPHARIVRQGSAER